MVGAPQQLSACSKQCMKAFCCVCLQCTQESDAVPETCMVNSPQPSAETVVLLPTPEHRDGIMLQDLLKDKGQSTKGKKEDLVKRIMDYQKREAIASRPH
jgi:hypothetical protein